MADDHPVPKDRETLKGGDWFPFVLSKLAPLEWWSYEESASDVKRENYPGDSSYQRSVKMEFPHFCFSMFRPPLESFGALLNAVTEYQGGVAWQVYDGDCIVAFPSKPVLGMVFLNKNDKATEEYIASLRKRDAAFLQRAVGDIPALCSYLEKNLGLTELAPKQFDSGWLTVEGLAQSKGEFEDFFDPGLWSVFLTGDPDNYARTSEPTSPDDRSLGMELTLSQRIELFEELHANWNAKQDGGEDSPIIPGFPLLSRFSDPSNDATYKPNEIAPFLAELARAQQIVKGRRSIRGLDNLIRVGRWAEKLQLGIYFGGV